LTFFFRDVELADCFFGKKSCVSSEICGQLKLKNQIVTCANQNKMLSSNKIEPGKTVASREFEKNILENLDVGIIVANASDMRLIYINKTGRAILSDGKQKPERKLLHSFQDFILKETGDDKKPRSRTLRLKDKVIGFTVYTVSTTQLCVIFRDITEKERMESVAQVSNLMENLGFIFAGIQHEIANPVNCLKMAITVLKAGITKFDQVKIESYLDRMLEDIGRVEYLLRSFKNFNMFEEPEIQPLEINAFTQRILHIMSQNFADYGVVVATKIRPDSLWVQADPRFIHHIFLNILTNACHALEGRTEPKIMIKGSHRAGLVRLSIEDNGCGMTREQRKNLFRPFYTTKPKGTGLGLVITRRLLSGINGSINIDSRYDIGTKVILHLPQSV